LKARGRQKRKLYPGRAAEPQNLGGLAATDGYMPFTLCVSSRWSGIQLIYSVYKITCTV
jgi:hypothetical protein